MDVTLAFLSRHRVKELGQALHTLTKGTKVLPFPAIVIDDYSDPSFLAMKRQVFREYPEVRVVETSRRRGGGKLRNWAVFLTDTRYVIFSNDDVQFKPGFADLVKRVIEEGYEIFYFMNSACFLFDKAIIPEFGWPGEERYEVWYYEDCDLSARAQHEAREGKLKIGGDNTQTIHVCRGMSGTGNPNTDIRPDYTSNGDIAKELWSDSPDAIDWGLGWRYGVKVPEVDWHPRETFDITWKFPRNTPA